MKKNTEKKRILILKNFLKKRSSIILKILLILIILIQSALLGVLYIKNQKLERRFNILVVEHNSTKEEFQKIIDEAKKNLTDTAGVTAFNFQALVETVKELESWKLYVDDFVKTFNNNVDIYNSQLNDLYGKTNSLQRKLDVITGYLTR